MPPSERQRHANGNNGNGNGHGEPPATESGGNGDGNGIVTRPSSAPSGRDDRARIAAMIERALESGPAEIVSISQVSHHGDSRVANIPTMERSPLELASQLIDAAQDDARLQRGVARYVCGVHRRADGPADAGRAWLGVLGTRGNLDASVYEDPEGPTPEGMVAQSQRHTEYAMRLALVSAQQTITDLRQELDGARAENERFMGRHLDILSTYEQLLKARNVARLEEHVHETKQRRDRMMEDRLLLTLDHVMAHWGIYLPGSRALAPAGGSPAAQQGPVSATVASATGAQRQEKQPDARAEQAAAASGASDPHAAARWFARLNWLVESITREQFMAMAQTLSLDQRGTCVELYREYAAGVVSSRPKEGGG